MTCSVCTTVCRWRRFDNWWTVNWAMLLEPLCVLKRQRSATSLHTMFSTAIHRKCPDTVIFAVGTTPVPLYCPLSLLLFLSSPSVPSSLLSPLLFSSFLLSLLSTSPLFLSSPSSTHVPFPSNTSWHNVGHYYSVPLYYTPTYIIMEVFPISLAQAILSKQASLHRTGSSWTTGSVVKMGRVGGLGRNREGRRKGWKVREK